MILHDIFYVEEKKLLKLDQDSNPGPLGSESGMLAITPQWDRYYVKVHTTESL